MEFLKRLPKSIFSALLRYVNDNDDITEIRLRSDRNIVLTTLQKKIYIDHIVTKDELDLAILAICDGSLHAHDETIMEGYISSQNGIRVGICGKAVTQDNKICGVYDFTSLNIRIPRHIYGISNNIIKLIQSKNYNENILIYSSPGIGKTTVIRDIARTLSEPPHNIKVGVIDSRCEISDKILYKCSNIDILENYPKAKAIEIAVRTMSCEYIICDEIGSYDEAKSLLSVQNSGVPVIASAHAENVIDLLMRPNIRILHEACCFDTYIGLKRAKDSMKFSFTSREEIV